MSIRLTVTFAFLIFAFISTAQDRFYTKSGNISFYSKAPLEDIEATHRSAVCVLDTKTGSLQFTMLIKGFEFENEEMQEHFNEDYLESNKYPKAEFKGQIVNNATVNYGRPGTYPVRVTGQLTIHGVTKEVQSAGTIKVEGSGLVATSSFTIPVADYNIKIPSLVKDKVAKTVKITVDTKLAPFK
ncbi:MAG: polyisoprenoid-binding protein [Segetibacter sp.]|jgi:polyisoprenoid-binding protein YceI|nr:polyisoprenoid-binding protein [Segetibacter sp.]